MGKIIFILGGAKSGKSSFALTLVEKEKNVLFVATAKPSDSEMKEKIKRHKKSRPKSMKTLEIKNNLLEIFEEHFDTAIIDCLTIYVSNKIFAGTTEKEIVGEIRKFLTTLKRKNTVLVSNEVGSGIVPKNKLARKFRDILGNINQLVSAFSDKVYFIIAGNPFLIKGGALHHMLE